MYHTWGKIKAEVVSREKIIYRLKEARKLKGLSLREAGAGLGISHESVHRFEKGSLKVDNERLIQFANFYGVTLDYLIPKERPKVEFGEITFFKVSDDGMRIKHFKQK